MGGVACQEETTFVSPVADAVGMSQQVVREQFGEPDRVQELARRDSPVIFGTVELYWASLEPGDRVVIWAYERSETTYELHFLRGSTRVDYVMDYPTGAVF